MTCDVHHVPGRIRFKIPGLRTDELLVRALPGALRTFDGVDRVEVRPASNSLVIHYDPFRVDCRALAQTINQSLAMMTENKPAAASSGGLGPLWRHNVRTEEFVIDSVRHMGIVFGRTAFKVALEQVVRGGLSSLARATHGRY